MNNIKKLKIAIESLSIYRGLLEDKVIKRLSELVNYLLVSSKDVYSFIEVYNNFYYELVKVNGDNTFRYFVINKFLYDENVFTKNIAEKNIAPQIVSATKRDLMFNSSSSRVELCF